jgi:hypothetical protein
LCARIGGGGKDRDAGGDKQRDGTAGHAAWPPAQQVVPREAKLRRHRAASATANDMYSDFTSTSRFLSLENDFTFLILKCILCSILEVMRCIGLVRCCRRSSPVRRADVEGGEDNRSSAKARGVSAHGVQPIAAAGLAAQLQGDHEWPTISPRLSTPASAR